MDGNILFWAHQFCTMVSTEVLFHFLPWTVMKSLNIVDALKITKGSHLYGKNPACGTMGNRVWPFGGRKSSNWDGAETQWEKTGWK